MPIDEDLIDSIIQKLNEEMQNLEFQKSKINRCYVSLGVIMQQKQRIQNENTGAIETKLLPIIDPGTGKLITSARRQDVYDACMAEARKILGIKTSS